MSQEWLDIQSFFADNQILRAITDLSVAGSSIELGSSIQRVSRCHSGRAARPRELPISPDAVRASDWRRTARRKRPSIERGLSGKP